MKVSVHFILLLVSCLAFSQSNYKGQVLNATTNQPIPYVNIGIVEKGIGTVSDEEGLFNLFTDDIKIIDTDNIQFSSLGYQTKTMSISNARFALKDEFRKIEMRPADIILNEVVVSDSDLVPITDFVGYRNSQDDSFGYWKDNEALGGELATRITASKTRRELMSIEFEVLINPADSLLLRINIYDIERGENAPSENLNKSQKNILYTLKKDELIVNVNLQPYEIYVKDDFYVSLELVKRFDDKPVALVLAASNSRAGSFRRYASQGKWEKISDVNMAFYLETTRLVSQKKANKFEKKVQELQLKRNSVSGFTIFRGNMIADVHVFNKRTKESTSSDDNGRYSIHADKDDVLYFTKSGFKNTTLKIGKHPFANAILKL